MSCFLCRWTNNTDTWLHEEAYLLTRRTQE